MCGRAGRAATRPAPCARDCGDEPPRRRPVARVRHGRKSSRRIHLHTIRHCRRPLPKCGWPRYPGTTGRVSRPPTRSSQIPESLRSCPPTARADARQATAHLRRPDGWWARPGSADPGHEPAPRPARPGAAGLRRADPPADRAPVRPPRDRPGSNGSVRRPPTRARPRPAGRSPRRKPSRPRARRAG